MHLLALLTRFLRLVASQSSTNLMTAEKLGVIFGAILCKEVKSSERSMEEDLLYLRNRTVLSILIRYCISEWSALFETLSRPLEAPKPLRADSSATLFTALQKAPSTKTTPVSKRSITPVSSQKQKVRVSPASSLRYEENVSPSLKEKKSGTLKRRSLRKLDTRPEALQLVDEVSPPTTFLAADSDSDDDILPNCSISAVGKIKSPQLHFPSPHQEDEMGKKRQPPLLLVRPSNTNEVVQPHHAKNKTISSLLVPSAAPSPALTATTNDNDSS